MNPLESMQVIEIKRLRHDEDGRMMLDGELFSGVGIDHWPDGSRASEICFLAGVEHGKSVLLYPSGARKRETSYVGGRAIGPDREWYENGILKMERIIGERGIVLEMCEWDSSGVLVSEFLRESG